MHKKTALLTDSRFTLHLTGYGHVESPARVVAITKALQEAGLLDGGTSLAVRPAIEEEITLAHDPAYIALVRHESQLARGVEVLSTGDVMISKESFAIAQLAVGAVLNGLKAVFENSFSSAFCIVRPPGHHACRSQGMGFCLFNNVAIGALYALKHYPIDRVLIVDWDVHHGNGTQDIVQNDERIFYFSTHQSPLYPGTGFADEKGVGNILNVPIAAGPESRTRLLHAFRKDLADAMEKFKPELILISAGFDAHFQDPLGGLNLTEEDFAELTSLVSEIARKFAKGRIVSVLEGGYNLDAIAKSATAHVKALSYLT